MVKTYKVVRVKQKYFWRAADEKKRGREIKIYDTRSPFFLEKSAGREPIETYRVTDEKGGMECGMAMN